MVENILVLILNVVRLSVLDCFSVILIIFVWREYREGGKKMLRWRGGGY